MSISNNSQEIESALYFINPNLSREEWARVAMALKSELSDGEGFALFDAWSQGGDSYKPADCRATWRSINANGGVTIASLFYMAKQAGWKPDNVANGQRDPKPISHRVQRDPNHNEIRQTQTKAQSIWNLVTPAPDNNPYLVEKQIQPHGIGVLGCQFKHLPWKVRNNGNVLVIPRREVHGGAAVSLQFISDNNKAYLAGRQPKGSVFQIGEIRDGFYICEGFATGASLHQNSGDAVFLAFDCGNLLAAGLALRLRHPKAEIYFMADDDWQIPGNPGLTKAKEASSQIDNAKVCYPPFDPNTRPEDATDFNDYVRLQNEACR